MTAPPSEWAIGSRGFYADLKWISIFSIWVCLDLAELLATERVVPVVIFLHDSPAIPRQLALGSERHRYLAFDYLACVLAVTPAERYLDSDHLVARLNLPNMQWTPEQKVDIYTKAIEGLLTLEPNIEK